MCFFLKRREGLLFFFFMIFFYHLVWLHSFAPTEWTGLGSTVRINSGEPLRDPWVLAMTSWRHCGCSTFNFFFVFWWLCFNSWCSTTLVMFFLHMLHPWRKKFISEKRWAIPVWLVQETTESAGIVDYHLSTHWCNVGVKSGLQQLSVFTNAIAIYSNKACIIILYLIVL